MSEFLRRLRNERPGGPEQLLPIEMLPRASWSGTGKTTYICRNQANHLMGLLISYFMLSIVFSFLCSIWEAVLLSVTPSYIKVKQSEDPAVGQLLARLKTDIDRPLSAILTLNTIAHTVGAIGVGAQAGQMFGTEAFDVAGIAIPYESIIATLMTLAILFLSEIIPKTLGANDWKSLAPFTSRSLPQNDADQDEYIQVIDKQRVVVALWAPFYGGEKRGHHHHGQVEVVRLKNF